MQKLVIYAGRFQPFHKGHFASYTFLVKHFGVDSVYVVTSNSRAPLTSPFGFEEKQKMMELCGVPSDKIVMQTSPYRPTGITNQFDATTTQLIFAVSEKDIERFAFKKKDGSLGYMQPYPKNKEYIKPMNEHGYVLLTPTINFKVAGKTISSATAIRAAYVNGDKSLRKLIIYDLYGSNDKEITQIFNNRLAITENLVGLMTNLKESKMDQDDKNMRIIELAIQMERELKNIEEINLDEAESVSDPYKNLPGKSTHMLNRDVRGDHGIINMGTLLRHTGGDRYEVRAGKAKGKILRLHKDHVMLPPDFDEDIESNELRNYVNEDRTGQRVRIHNPGTAGSINAHFHGKTGRIQHKDGNQYRVKLDTAVHVPGVGHVTDDLWDGNLLKKIKEEVEINEVSQRVPHHEWVDIVKQEHPGVQLIKNMNQHGTHISTWAIIKGKYGGGEKVGQYTMHTGVGTFKASKPHQKIKGEVDLDEEGKVYDPFTKKMVPTRPIKSQAGGGATRNGVPVEPGPSKYKERLKNKEVELEEGSFKYHMDKAIAAHDRNDTKNKEYHLGNAKTARYALPSNEYAKHKDLFAKYKQMTEEVDLDESNEDFLHARIKSEYDSLKKQPFSYVKSLIKLQHKIVDVSGYENKEHAISSYLNDKHGHKRVSAALNSLKEVDLDEDYINEVQPANKAGDLKGHQG